MSDLIPALARVMAELHPGWDVPGCASALSRAKFDLHPTPQDLAIAAVEFAKRDDLRTPALLAQDGPHWHTGRTPNVRVKSTRCDVPGHEYETAATCRLCPVESYDPTTAPTLGVLSPQQQQINSQGLALVRDALNRKEAS